mmetsp:Transcript_49317/g.127208  ORF Transcript_49317/g.127208 Transcript_49317/m.127208 type:complete len:338 (+) Transcript_49317:120-1133(+)
MIPQELVQEARLPLPDLVAAALHLAHAEARQPAAGRAPQRRPHQRPRDVDVVVHRALQPEGPLGLVVRDEAPERCVRAVEAKLVAGKEADAADKAAESEPRRLPQVHIEGHGAPLRHASQVDGAAVPELLDLRVEELRQPLPRGHQRGEVADLVAAPVGVGVPRVDSLTPRLPQLRRGWEHSAEAWCVVRAQAPRQAKVAVALQVLQRVATEAVQVDERAAVRVAILRRDAPRLGRAPLRRERGRRAAVGRLYGVPQAHIRLPAAQLRRWAAPSSSASPRPVPYQDRCEPRRHAGRRDCRQRALPARPASMVLARSMSDAPCSLGKSGRGTCGRGGG